MSSGAAGVRPQPRVCSLLPSATEMLCFIGGAHLLVGRSHEDNYPECITHLPVLTGQTTTFTTAAAVNQQVSQSLASGQSLYTLDIERLRALQPDVILTQDICNVCAIDLPTVEKAALQMDPQPRVVSLNPLCLEDVLRNLIQLGDAVGLQAEAEQALARLQSRAAAVDRLVEEASAGKGTGTGSASRPNTAFIEWSDPLYVGGHWTPQLIQRAGGHHPLNSPHGHKDSAEQCQGHSNNGAGKSFPIPSEKLVQSDPDFVVICCCGLKLPETRREASRLQAQPWWKDLRAVKAGKVALVDGDAMFNRPGPRLIDALEWLAATFHGLADLVPRDFPVEWLPPNSWTSLEGAPSEAAEAAARARIEEVHRTAVRKKELTYEDPETGYTVFTQLQGIQRGYCCGSGCRHCPYNHMNVPPERKPFVKPPITCDM
mmetsp:Transcript_35584/g.83159  ORF Transcript_35584/g.83159 Transcript_35584/m.83159 type:complete len:430 (+) Transcript_35584:84-1373(+)